jgi:hypothetical protein
MSTVAPLAGADGDLGAPTINVKNVDGGPPSEVSKLENREHPPSTLINFNGGPPGEEPELEIREHPSSMLKNIDGGPAGGC